MNNSEFYSLLDRYLTGNLSVEERERLTALLNDDHYRALLEASMEKTFMEDTFTGNETEGRRKRLNSLILGRIQHQVRTARLRRLLAYAAAAVLLIGIGIFYLLKTRLDQLPTAHLPLAQNDVAPGGSGAILTLADGSRMQLDSMANGVVATQTGVRVMLQKGQLVYDAAPGASDVVYNSISTPNGRQFCMKLPDGTAVWLNAASTIRYPVAFKGKERLVEITGEAYFEVAQHTNMPFKVKINETSTVEVLGTHFNINAYKDEPGVTATLLEGAVRVRYAGETATLKPGQQALMAGGPIKLNTAVNIDKVMAWKNGLFNFDGASLQQVMKQLERWYNIEVVYEKGVPDLRFGGELSRNLKLSEILNTLQDVHIHFRIENNRKLIVMP
ncbi:FecR family protein [Chitinophaga polysaccharea]|uniref:FecR family protein n=1 Tax=Chitinophaga polysaccharea TaxID=1293035 RepID=A0A561PQM1_9BACT|nr:FecR domain-containing protein [Chitinophaga polysaccharea]TWF40408.1 FecR family protein [Chitinophaga polysaccharea]